MNWAERNFDSPAPHFVKMRVLTPASEPGVWIESGTYVGQTTAELAQRGGLVFSIEPSKELATEVMARLGKMENIRIINDLSENVLDDLITEVIAANYSTIAFWLDGHYSEGITHLGPVETPIISELEIISKHMNAFKEVTIYIDDFRCFVAQLPDYPTPYFLSEWAESQKATWDVRHDIFIISKRN